eukprot:6606897-Pyramimonas_sp.AAC.1
MHTTHPRRHDGGRGAVGGRRSCCSPGGAPVSRGGQRKHRRAVRALPPPGLHPPHPPAVGLGADIKPLIRQF